MIIFKNTTGTEKISLQKNEKKVIQLEDFAMDNRNFSLEVSLLGDNAEVSITGRLQSRKNQVKKWDITLIFQGKNQIGSIDIRGIAEGESLLMINASGILSKQSQEATIAINEKIVLFDTAKGQCIPILTVKTDQVKSASHAATVAPFDPLQKIYCQSRGISAKETDNLLKKGFLVC